MLASSDTTGHQIAKSLGLSTENLNSFNIDFTAGNPVVISATYYVEEPTLVTVLEPFTDTKQYVIVEATNVGNSL